MPARTSQNHPLQIDSLGPLGRGRLGLTFCPGKFDPHAQTGAWDRDLDTDLRALCTWGASTVVTLMETHELELLRVPEHGDRVSRIGLRWWHLPIVDGDVPDARFERAWGRAGEDLRRRLVEFGEAPESAPFRVRRARSGTVENRRQEDYVRGLAAVQGMV